MKRLLTIACLVLISFSSFGEGAADPVYGRSRIGLTADLGWGTENHTLFVRPDKKNVNISLGKNYAFGVRYGYELTRNFEMDADINFEGSTLTTPITNVKARVAYGSATLTANYVLMLGGNLAKRLKFGAGVDYNFSPRLVIRAKDFINGFDATWNYDNAIGYHINAMYEYFWSEFWSADLGLKWTGIAYHLNSGTTFVPDVFRNPGGNAINVMAGVYYHF